MASKSDTQNYWSLAAGQKPGSLGIAEYSLAIPELEIKNLLNFRRLHLAIWQMRTHDLQAMFDIDTEHGRVGYLAWCVSAGISEYKALAELRPFCDELSSVADIPPTKWSGGVSRLIQLAIFATPHLNISYELKTEREQLEALTWYFCSDGFRSFPAPNGMPDWQKDFLIDNPDLLASRLGQLVYRGRPDVRAAFSFESTLGVEGFRHWMATNGLAETGLNKAQKNCDGSQPLSPPQEHLTAKPFGVNLIGYAFGELGIGEDVRMAAKSLHTAGVPFTVINYEPGSAIRQNDDSISEWVAKEHNFLINIFCLTALEHFRFYAENGEKHINGYYNIGYWPWELHDWPVNWNHCFSLVDEVWASSEHISNSIGRAGFDKSALMPMAVSVPSDLPSREDTRSLYKIDQDRNAFIFSFDGNSSFKRKNPTAILNAFKEAFPEGETNVALIIKCMRADHESDAWRYVQHSANTDDRIILIDQMMDKPDVIALYSACDCFVSLHRAEGFGRGIAEALLLNLDVVATDYGGNTDFCRALDTLSVNFKLIQTTTDCYVESRENFWAEPEIGDAALRMREATSDARKSSRNANFAERTAKLYDIFSHDKVGVRYSERLSEIYELADTHSLTAHSIH